MADPDDLEATWESIVAAFSQRPPPAPVQMCLLPVFEARIVGIRFLSPVRVARRGVAITGEHWTEGVDVVDPNVADGSLKPAVVRISGRGEPGVRLRIRVIRSVAVGPSGPVSGSLGGLALTSLAQCPTSVGDHVVDARIVLPHPFIARDAGNASWQINVSPLGNVALGSTRLELVTILDTPVRCFAAGVWIEVLRLLLSSAGVAGLETRRAAGAAAVRFAHTGLQLAYDTFRGSAHFNSGSLGANAYLLARLISPIQGKEVNCYDMAAAVSALAGALGVNLGWKYMEPFGYLAPTHLIGVAGQCNNPFFRGWVLENNQWVPACPTPMAPPGNRRRTSFGNHAFTSFTTLGNANLSGVDAGPWQGIGDACAGPATFTATLEEYVLSSVDQNVPINPARIAALAQFGIIDRWEQGQLAAVSVLPSLVTSEQRRQMIETIHAQAALARVQAHAALAATETAAVQDGVGVNSLEFTGYSGP